MIIQISILHVYQRVRLAAKTTHRMNKKLYRSKQNKTIAGVCGGLAEHLGWDADKLRIGYVVLSVLSAAFPGLLVYLVLWFVIPENPAQV